MACCGDDANPRDARRGRPDPTTPAVAEVRVVNVVDPDAPATGYGTPTRMSTLSSTPFPADRPIVFAYRLPVADPPARVPANESANMHVRGYKEEGTTTTPFDMVMLNDLDRFHLVIDVIDRVPVSRRARARPAADGGQATRVPRVRVARAKTQPRSAAGPSRNSGRALRVLVVNAGSPARAATARPGRRAARLNRPGADEEPTSWLRQMGSIDAAGTPFTAGPSSATRSSSTSTFSNDYVT